jgi:hypothetical protein
MRLHRAGPTDVDAILANPVETDPRDGLEASLGAAADRYGLDAKALIAAARSALAAPDREIVLEVGARTPA